MARTYVRFGNRILILRGISETDPACYCGKPVGRVFSKLEIKSNAPDPRATHIKGMMIAKMSFRLPRSW